MRTRFQCCPYLRKRFRTFPSVCAPCLRAQKMLPYIYYSGVGILRELPPEEMEEAFRQHLIERNKEKTA